MLKSSGESQWVLRLCGGKKIKSIFPSNFLTLIPMVTYFHSQEKEKEKWLHHCQLVRSNLEIQVQPILLDDGVIRAISGLSQYVSSKPFRSVAGKVKRTCTVRSGPFSGHMCLLKSGLNPTLYQEYHMWFFFFFFLATTLPSLFIWEGAAEQCRQTNPLRPGES